MRSVLGLKIFGMGNQHGLQAARLFLHRRKLAVHKLIQSNQQGDIGVTIQLPLTDKFTAVLQGGPIAHVTAIFFNTSRRGDIFNVWRT